MEEKFKYQFFGYDKEQVEEKLQEDAKLIAIQEKDIAFLKDKLMKVEQHIIDK